MEGKALKLLEEILIQATVWKVAMGVKEASRYLLFQLLII